MAPVPGPAMLIAAFFGGWEILLVSAVVLVLICARRLPELFSGFGRGIREFHAATRDVTRKFDSQGRSAGESLGGIYGKPAAQAITSDNQVAEFYDVSDQQSPRRLWAWLIRILRRLASVVRSFRK